MRPSRQRRLHPHLRQPGGPRLDGDAWRAALAGDGARFPASATAGLSPWTPLKFYRTTSYWQGAGATFHYNAGEYSPLLGRSYAEIAGESRSQHLSQGFGMLQRKGFVPGSVRREDSRAPAPRDPNAERSIFDGIDTTYRRLRAQVPAFDEDRYFAPDIARAAGLVRSGALVAVVAVDLPAVTPAN